MNFFVSFNKIGSCGNNSSHEYLDICRKASTRTDTDVTSIKAQLIKACHKNDIGNVGRGIGGWAAGRRALEGGTFYTQTQEIYTEAAKCTFFFSLVRPLGWHVICFYQAIFDLACMAVVEEAARPGGWVLEQGTICTAHVRSWYKMWLKSTGNYQLCLFFFCWFWWNDWKRFHLDFLWWGLSSTYWRTTGDQLGWTLGVARPVGTDLNLGRRHNPWDPSQCMSDLELNSGLNTGKSPVADSNYTITTKNINNEHIS